MSTPRISIEADVCEDDQVGSFQNATLQSAGGKYSMSIATTLDIPEEVGDLGQDAIVKYLKEQLGLAVKNVPGLSFEIQIGLDCDHQDDDVSSSDDDSEDGDPEDD